MENMMYSLFLCIVAPLILMLFLLEKKSRLTFLFMIIGCIMCLFISEINSLIVSLSDMDSFYATTTITPITEEIVKALPVLLFAFAFSDDRETLLSISMALGVGFAVFENVYLLVNGTENPSVLWSLVRGFGAALMHGICTSAVGYGISFVRKRKKLFCTGTFALLSAAIIYHATYNCLVQSSFDYIGFLLPVLTYIPFVAVMIQKRKTKKQ